MILPLNELSMRCLRKTREECSEILLGLVSNCAKIQKVQDNLQFLLPIDFMERSLNGEENISRIITEWKRSGGTKQKSRAILLSMWNRHRSFAEVNFVDCSFSINGTEESIGCLFAYKENCAVLSLNSDSAWENESIYGTYDEIKGDEWFKTSQTIPNISTKEHTDIYVQKVRDKIRDEIQDGRKLWETRKIVFPHLVFCDSVEESLNKLEHIHIASLINSLCILEQYFSQCDNSYDIGKVGHNARSESTTVKKSEKYKKYRLFTLPNGERKYFFDHVSFGIDFPGRIHYLPDCPSRIGYIGYIGKHLPTKEYPTI